MNKQEALDALELYHRNMEHILGPEDEKVKTIETCIKLVEEIEDELPSAQPERLTDDDFETIRIHLSAYKERLCNQHRWKEAEEYQRIIDRFMSFASAQPVIRGVIDESGRIKFIEQAERKKGKWIVHPEVKNVYGGTYIECSQCGEKYVVQHMEDEKYCRNCGAKMEEYDE